MSQSEHVNALAAADAALLRARRITAYVFLVAAGKMQEQPESFPHTVAPEPAPTVIPVVPAATSSPFPCMATAETSNVPAMGPTYWTVYGMVRDIIVDYGTPEEQAAVFDGTATLWQQTDIASRFAADHGFGGWGVLTRQKCHL